jgi:lactate dehydrogenase-like 2-hydroxyacid dehydrogenase
MSAPADRPVLVVTRHLPDAVEERAARDYRVIRLAEDRPIPAAELAALAADNAARGILLTPTERMDRAAIEGLPACVEAIATFSVGYDHIDLAAAKARGLQVFNTPDVVAEATADIAMLVMLGAARRAYEGQRMLRTGGWSGWSPTFMLGTDLRGRRLGLVGFGRIGQATARRAKAFGMTIHYHQRRRLDAGTLGADLADAVYHDSLDDLVAVADVLSLHCPATPETIGMINAERIARLPAGAILVNTARGPLVDDAAAIAALTSGRLRAAGLDVFTGEPQFDPRWAELDNAYLLPHMGTSTVETRAAMGFRALDNLDAFFAGATPRDRLA